jgi:PAS domain S-box-containing protein
MSRLRSSWERYLVAVVAVAGASLLYLLAEPQGVDSDVRYFGFTMAVLLSSVVAGVGPGLLATTMAAFVTAYLLLPPLFSIRIPLDDRAGRFFLFVTEGLLLSLVGGTIHDARTADAMKRWTGRYLPAALFVFAATGLKLLLRRDLERDFPFSFFYAATAASAWVGGFAPGLIATFLAALCATYFFIDPVHSLSVSSPTDAARVLLFTAEGTALSFLTGQYPAARRLAGEGAMQVAEYGRRLLKGREDQRALKAISRDITWEWDLPSSMVRVDEGEDQCGACAETDFAPWLRQIHPKDRLKVLASLKSAMLEGRSEWTFEYRRLNPGKGYMRVSDRARIIRDNAWNPIRVVGRSAETWTAPGFGNEGTYRAFFENSPQAILLADNGLRIVAANEAACDILGYGRSEITRLSVQDLLRGSTKRMLELQVDDPLAITFEEDCIRAGGEVFRAKVNAAMVAGIDNTSADRIITIEEVAESETSS